MKIVAALVGVLLVGWYVDSQFYNGQYVRAFATMTQSIATSFGIRW